MDFDCGMMGYFDCPDCKAPMLPLKRNKTFKLQYAEANGPDMGWLQNLE